jgi:HTH-type transcriptional regulator/antitoxin HigA
MTVELEKMTLSTKELQQHWSPLRAILTIRKERDYERAVRHLNALLDEVGTHERHPLYGLLEALGTLLEAYEEKHHPLPELAGAEMLRFFMDEHALARSDFPEVGSQGVVSEVLAGKRELDVRQIRALAKRFHLSTAVFI